MLYLENKVHICNVLEESSEGEVKLSEPVFMFIGDNTFLTRKVRCGAWAPSAPSMALAVKARPFQKENNVLWNAEQTQASETPAGQQPLRAQQPG